MIVIHPVLETGALPDFEFWPVAEQPPYHLTALNGTLSVEQVGTAVATIAGYNSSRFEDRLTDPADALEIARTELPRLLAGVQQDLANFLLLVAAWAEHNAPQSEQALVSAFDRSLEITVPLQKSS